MAGALPPTVNPDTLEINYTSVSALKKADEQSEGGCQRRYYFNYRLRMKEPQTKAKDKGGEIHNQIEHYLLTGQDGLGKEAREAKHLIPEPGPDLLVESRGGRLETLVQLNPPKVKSHVYAGDIPLVGKVDCANPRGLHVARAHREDGAPDPVGTVEMNDWKSTKDLKWAKSGAELGNDLQMLGYSPFVKKLFPEAKYVRLSHVYILTGSKRGADKRTILLPLDQALERWHIRSTPLAETIKTVVRAPDVMDVRPNWNACKAYGGCPFAEQCTRGLPIIERLKKMNLLDSIRAKKAPTAPPPAEEVKAVTPPVPPAAMTKAGPRYSPQQQEHFNVDENGNPRKKLLIEDHTEQKSVTDHIPAAPVVKVLPDDAPPINMELAAECVTHPGQVHTKAACEALKAPPPEAPATDAPKKRGRPKKVQENKDTITPVVNVAQSTPTPIQGSPVAAVHGAELTTPGPQAEGVAETEGAKAPEVVPVPVADSVNTGISFYYNAVPNEPAKPLDPYVHNLMAQLAKLCGEEGVDIRASENPLFKYKKWQGTLASAIKQAPPEPGVYVLIGTSELYDTVAEAMKSISTRYAQGVR